MNIETFKALRNYAKGNITKYELLDSEKLFSHVREVGDKPGQTVISIEFDDEEQFLKSIGLSEDDVYFYQAMNSPYTDYDFYDHYSSTDQFMEGYGIYDVMDDDNIELLSQIGRSILPMKFDMKNDKYLKELSDKLMTNFKDEVNSLLNDYNYEMNSQMRSTAQEVITDQVDDYLKDLGLTKVGDNGIKITVTDLLRLYIENGNILLPLSELLKDIFKGGEDLGGWMEDPYQFEDISKFDRFNFNRDVSRTLNRILNTIEELGDGDGVTVEDFTKMTERVTKKFQQGKFYTLPKNPDIRFKIDGFRFPMMKIFVQLQRGLKRKDVTLTEDNFYHLLYQPSLFNLDEL